MKYQYVATKHYAGADKVELRAPDSRAWRLRETHKAGDHLVVIWELYEEGTE